MSALLQKTKLRIDRRKVKVKLMKTKKSTFWLVNIIGLLLMFVFPKVVSPFGPVTEIGVAVIGVFLGVIFMSLFSNQMFYVALMGMAALVYHGYMSGSEMAAAFLGNTTVTQLIFVVALCGALQSTGAMDVIAKKLLTAKFLKGRPLLLTMSFLLISYLISTVVMFISACILMHTVLESVYKVAGYDEDDPFVKHMLLGVYIASMGSYALPFMGIQLTSIAMLRTSMDAYGLVFNTGVYTLTNVIIFVVFILLYTLSMKYVFHCNLEPLRTVDVSKSEKLQLTPDHISKQGWIYLSAFVLCIVYTVGLNVVPSTWRFYSVIFGFTSPWMWIVAVAILTVVRVDGERLMSGNDMLKNGVMWNLVALVGMFSVLGSAMTNEEIGIRTWLINLIGSMFNSANIIVMVILVVLVVTIATNVVNGLPCVLASVAIVMPFVCQMELDTGISASVVGTLINVCANMAFLTYSGSVYASLILGRKEITQKFMWTRGLITMIMFIAVAIVLGIGLCYIL
ncbi:MAG: hypothetical protein LUE90_05620 [Clostridiales bacterium]|nr:hypothetical protein [Clostridiales bacterium]